MTDKKSTRQEKNFEVGSEAATSYILRKMNIIRSQEEKETFGWMAHEQWNIWEQNKDWQSPQNK